jgi:hypothetical protein
MTPQIIILSNLPKYDNITLQDKFKRSQSKNSTKKNEQ